MKGSNVNSNSNFPRFFGNSGVYRGKNSKGKDRPICTYCRKLRHVMEKCFKVHGFPPGFKPKGKNFMVNQVNAQRVMQIRIQHLLIFLSLKSNVNNS